MICDHPLHPEDQQNPTHQSQSPRIIENRMIPIRSQAKHRIGGRINRTSKMAVWGSRLSNGCQYRSPPQQTFPPTGGFTLGSQVFHGIANNDNSQRNDSDDSLPDDGLSPAKS